MYSELIEIVVQTFALCVYGGYPIFSFTTSIDPNEIKLFALILGLNSITTGILWILYLIDVLKFRGVLFECIIFVNDIIFDFFYTAFPLILNYNGEFPLFNTKSLALLNASNDALFFSVYLASLLMAKRIYSISKKFSVLRILRNPDKMRKFNLRYKPFLEYHVGTNPKDVKWYKNVTFKKIYICVISFGFIIYGISITSSVYAYINKHIKICDNPSSSLLLKHPELYYYSSLCNDKVYPLFRDINSDAQIPCDCRDFRYDITEEDVFFDAEYVNYMLNRWNNLKVFHITINQEALTSNDPIHAGKSKFIKLGNIEAKALKDLQIKDIKFESIDNSFEDLIDLEILIFRYPELKALPNSLKSLKKLKLFDMNPCLGFTDLNDVICSWEEIRYIDVTLGDFKSIPDCVSRLKKLEVFLSRLTVHLESIPPALFTLPNIKSIVITFSTIKPDSLPAFEEESDNDLRVVYLQQTPDNPDYLCNSIDKLTEKQMEFIYKYDACKLPCARNIEINGTIFEEPYMTRQCTPYDFGNGVCNDGCNTYECGYDGGDCRQVLILF